MSSLSRLLVLILSIAVFVSSGQSCFAQVSDNSQSYEVLPKERIKALPKKVEIYQLDDSPLGDRQPLLLVHGLLGEYHPKFRWKELAEYLVQNQEFQKRYKIYLTRFNTKLSLKELTNQFRIAIRQFAPSQGVTILSISMSGAVLHSALKDPSVLKCVSRVITLGAFFRGSPLFCADWMKQTMLKRYLSPLSKLDHYLGYQIYFARHKNLLRDYAWDNSDGQMTKKQLRKHPPKQTDQISKEDQLAVDHKFYVYAGYLHNQYVPRDHGAIRTLVTAPYSFFKTTLPMHLDREHPALRFLNELIAKSLPSKGPSDDIIYPLNDGISPIASSLLLTDEFAARPDINKMNDLELIKTNTNAAKARLFDNIDHLTFIERQRPSGSSQKIIDKLSNEEPRPMFEWILKDLME